MLGLLPRRLLRILLGVVLAVTFFLLLWLPAQQYGLPFGRVASASKLSVRAFWASELALALFVLGDIVESLLVKRGESSLGTKECTSRPCPS